MGLQNLLLLFCVWNLHKPTLRMCSANVDTGPVGVNSRSLLINCGKMRVGSCRLWSYILTRITIYKSQRNPIYAEYQYSSWLGHENESLLAGRKCLCASWEGWRTELTSPAIKSFMTLQCFGLHSTRLASTNLCLHSGGTHTHTHTHTHSTGLAIFFKALH